MNEPIDILENTIIENNTNNNINNNNVNSKNNKGKKLLIGLFVLVVLIVVAVVTYIATMATPKKVFTSAIDKMFASVNKTDDLKSITGDFNIDINIDSKEENEIFDVLNNLDIKLDYAVDYENKKVNLALDSSFEGKELLNANLYAKDDNAYVYLEKIFNKYIQIPIEGYSEIFENEELMKNYKVIVSEIEKALEKSLKDEYFTSEKTTLSIAGKDTKVTKNILNLTAENMKKLTKDIITSLNNDTFIKSMAALTSTDVEDIKETLNEAMNEDLEVSEDEKFTIAIYTTGMLKEVVGFEVKDANDSLVILKENDETFKYTLNSSEAKMEGSIQITNKDGKEVINLTLSMNATEDISFTIKLGMSYKYNEKIEDVDTSNYVALENLSDTDQMTITMNLISNEGLSKLIEIFNSLSTPDTDYEDDYDYDYDYEYEYDDSTEDYYFDDNYVTDYE